MDALFHLPDKGVFGVPEGWRGIQSSNPACYVCCHDSSAQYVVKNANQTLRDLYRTAHKRQSAAAAAAKRQAKQPLDTSRPSKRHQLAASVLDNTPKAAAGGAAALIAADTAPGAGPLQDVLNCIASVGSKKNQYQQQQQKREAPLCSPKCTPNHQHPQQQPAHEQQQQQQHLQQHQSTQGQAARVPSDYTNHKQGRHGSSNVITSDSSSSKRQDTFTLEQLKAKTNKELVDLLRLRRCPVSGKKDELVRRLIDYQWRLKKATQGSAGVPAVPSRATPPAVVTTLNTNTGTLQPS